MRAPVVILVVMFLSIVIPPHQTSGLARLPLEPARIYNDGIYRLEIQSEDKFLTSGENGTALRTRWANRPDQKWRFTSVKDNTSPDKEGWTLSPINGSPGIPTVWKVTYVGHGKFRFMSLASGLCLAGFGTREVSERKCEKDSPYQRWLALETKST